MAWAHKDDKLAEFRQSKGLRASASVLTVSRLVRQNRVDRLIQAAALLRQTHPDVKVIIVGDGPDLPRLQSLTSSLALTTNILFLGAIYDEEDLAPWFQAATVFCYPQNIGLSLLHAFGYGLPVVTSDAVACHNPEIAALEPNVNGLMYQHASIEDLASKLRVVFDSPELRQRLSAGALRTVEEEYTLKRMVDGLETAIRFAHKHPRRPTQNVRRH
ncbi:glycosyltransferase [Gemmatimonadota bacterium]